MAGIGYSFLSSDLSLTGQINVKKQEEPEESKLPEEYQQVEYLESTGTQYLKTSILANAIDKIECSISINSIDNGDYNRFFGTDELGVRVNSSTNKFRCGWGTGSWQNTDKTAELNTKYNIVLEQNGLYVDDEFLLTPPYGSTFSKEIFILSPSGATHYKIYLFRLYKNSNVVAEFIPCYRKSDNKPGMYDVANNVFYANQGSGEFTVGPDVVQLPSEYQQVEYLESTGTQYIDTNYTLTNKNSAEVKVAVLDDNSNNKMIFGSRTGASSNNISMNITYQLVSDFNNSNYATYRATYTRTVGTPYIIYTSKEQRAIYDENKTLLAENTRLCEDTITTPQTAGIFSINPKPGSNWYNPSAKVYYMKIWENAVLVRNMIPCYRKSDNKPGMYDLVNNEFYTNLGSGEFTVGPDVN